MAYDPRITLANSATVAELLVIDTIRDITGKPITIRLLFQDKLRLLAFEIWCRKKHIVLKEALSIVLNTWTNKYSKNSKYGIGIKISTLVGPRSKEILEEYIKKNYPNRENIALEKERIRLAMISPDDLSDLDYSGDAFEFVKEYKKNISVLKEHDAVSKQKFKRRRFRGNPFV